MTDSRPGSFEDKAARYPGFTYTDDAWEEAADAPPRADGTDDAQKAMHDLINEADRLARYLRVASGGHLSLAVVRNHGRTLREREGMSWHDAHEYAGKIADGEIR